MRKLLPVIAAIAGVALLVWSLRSAGVGSVIEGVRRVGLGFILVFLLGAVRHLARAVVWTLCFDDRRSLTIGQAFREQFWNTSAAAVQVMLPVRIAFARGRQQIRSAHALDVPPVPAAYPYQRHPVGYDEVCLDILEARCTPHRLFVER